MANEELTRERVHQILDIYQSIHNRWATTNRFDYTIRAQERITGKTLEELKRVKFWVGIDGKGELLTLNEMVALFVLIGNQARQLKELDKAKLAEGGGQVKLSAEMNFRPSDAEIIGTLSQLQMEELIEELEEDREKTKNTLTFSSVGLGLFVLGMVFLLVLAYVGKGVIQGTHIVYMFGIAVIALAIFCAVHYGRFLQINMSITKAKKQLHVSTDKSSVGIDRGEKEKKKSPRKRATKPKP